MTTVEAERAKFLDEVSAELVRDCPTDHRTLEYIKEIALQGFNRGVEAARSEAVYCTSIADGAPPPRVSDDDIASPSDRDAGDSRSAAPQR
jgi:hypothetical protein